MTTNEMLIEVERVLVPYLVDVGWKLLGAIILWIVGGWVIGFITRISRDGMTSRKVDPTLITYGESSIKVVLRIVRFHKGSEGTVELLACGVWQ